MRTRLGTLALALAAGGSLLAGCGEEASTGADPAADPTSASPLPADAEVVAIVSASAAGGDVARTPTYVGDRLSLLRYAGRLDDRLRGQLVEAVEAHPVGDGRAVGAAVIAVGCDVPPTAYVTVTGDGYQVTAAKAADAQQECLVPVTSVAVLDLPADAFPAPPAETMPSAD